MHQIAPGPLRGTYPGTILIVPKNCRDIRQKVNSALQNGDLIVYLTPCNDDSVVYLTPWNGDSTGVSYTEELMPTNCFALFCPFLTILKPILNSENLYLYRLSGVSYTAELQLGGVPILLRGIAILQCKIHHC